MALPTQSPRLSQSETSASSYVDLGHRQGGQELYRVGVLALQGGFREHIELLSNFGPCLKALPVRTAGDLSSVDALIVPGGESSVMRMLASEFDLVKNLRDFANSGKPIWGVCAGMILLAEEIDGELPIVGGLGMKVRRNFFGRQSNSSLSSLALHNSALEAGCCAISHLIRAPAVCTSALEKVEVLATVPSMNDAVVAVRSKAENGLKLLATAFHPEITADKSWHTFFLENVCGIELERLRLFDLGRPLPEVGPNMLHGTRHAVTVTDKPVYGSTSVKYALPRFLQGGVIMDVVNKEQARVAEEAGACAVMALERIPADIKKDGGIARMSDPELIEEILQTVSLPVMAKARIGHFAEAEVLEALDVDCIDESEVLTPADEAYHIHKEKFCIPFVCGAKDLGEALRRIAEGAAMIRLKGDAGTGNVVHAVRHARQVFGEIRRLQSMNDDEVFHHAKNLAAPLELVQLTRKLGRLPVTTFAAGGIATPADVSMMMSMGCDGVFVGSGIFKGENSAKRAKAMVKACTFWNDAKIVANVSRNLGKGMVGILSKGETYNYVEDGKL